MVDDLRNHQAAPTAEERAWIDFDPVAFVLKLTVVAALGVMIGLYAGLFPDSSMRTATVESER